MPSVDQVRHALGIAERYAAEYGVGISASVPIPPCLIDPKEFPHVGFGFCPVGTKQAYWTIDPLGNIRPCNHSPTVLGNILDQSFRQIRRSEKLVELMETQPRYCSTCGKRQHCHGGCKAAAQVCYGTLIACDPFLELNSERVSLTS
jgi:radical SAM protein with 4Fe4S-binding SPASM domain